MLVGRLTKETTDLRRATVDFTPWIDTGETISSYTAPVITNLTAAARLTAGLPTVPDTTPLTVANAYLIENATMVQLFLAAGTPGMSYQVQFVATGSSTRQQTIELCVTIRGPADVIVVL
jgi:hypothetical protein